MVPEEAGEGGAAAAGGAEDGEEAGRGEDADEEDVATMRYWHGFINIQYNMIALVF